MPKELNHPIIDGTICFHCGNILDWSPNCPAREEIINSHNGDNRYECTFNDDSPHPCYGSRKCPHKEELKEMLDSERKDRIRNEIERLQRLLNSCGE